MIVLNTTSGSIALIALVNIIFITNDGSHPILVVSTGQFHWTEGYVTAS